MRLPRYRAEDVQCLMMQNVFLASALNEILVYFLAVICPIVEINAIRIKANYMALINF